MKQIPIIDNLRQVCEEFRIVELGLLCGFSAERHSETPDPVPIGI